MRTTRITATLVLAFLLGGSSAEVALRTRRAIERHRAGQEDGAAGELVSLELRAADGQVLARQRLIAVPGRASEIALRDPENLDLVRLSLRIETERQLSGDLLIAYALQIPGESISTSGSVSLTPGVEQQVDLGDSPVVATIFTIPVPSAAFDAYLAAERASAATSAPGVWRM